MKDRKLPGHRTLYLLLGALITLPMTGWSVLPASPEAGPAAPPPAATPESGFSSPARQVLKLLEAGVPEEVVKAYIESSSSAFNLTPENIIYLEELGVSSTLTTGMLTHDKSLRENANAA